MSVSRIGTSIIASRQTRIARIAAAGSFGMSDRPVRRAHGLTASGEIGVVEQVHGGVDERQVLVPA